MLQRIDDRLYIHFMTAAAREEFRKYLEETGLTDSITRVLAHLYDDFDNKPNPLQYLKQHLGCPPGVDAKELRRENEELRREIARLQAEIDRKKSA